MYPSLHSFVERNRDPGTETNVMYRPTSDRTKVRILVGTSDMRSCMKNRTRNGSYTGRLSWKQYGGYIFQILECYKSSPFVMESMESTRLK